MTDEPFGHRGHPSEAEKRRAAKIAIRLDRAVERLEKQGFRENEAEAFIAGVAFQKGLEAGETWTEAENAVETLRAVRAGHGAKEWSMNALILALFDIADLLA
jgi:hypothetical protein